MNLFRYSLAFALVACGSDSMLEEEDLSTGDLDAAEATDGPDPITFDFGMDDNTSWYAVNDTVMGGVSTGEVYYTDAEMVFEGTVSTDSNGGFTSVRSPDDNWDLRAYKTLTVRMKSEGQPFTMVLAHNPLWYQDQFRYDFDNETNDWIDIEIPLKDFELYSLQTGYPEPTGQTMRRSDRANILHMEFISKLFEDGPFKLQVDHVTFE